MKSQNQIQRELDANDSSVPISPPQSIIDSFDFDIDFNSDFFEQAQRIPESLTKALPDPDDWRRETMRGNAGAQHSEDPSDARRHNGFHDLQGVSYIPGNVVDLYGSSEGSNDLVYDEARYDYWLRTAYVDKNLKALVQRAFVGPVSERASNYRDITEDEPKPEPVPPPGSNEIHSSWLQTFASSSDNSRPVGSEELTPEVTEDGSRILLRSPDKTFGPNSYFELAANFSQMKTGGVRHSFWLMPAVDENGNLLNTAYNDNEFVEPKRNDGVEIDIYEHEVTNNADQSSRMLLTTVTGGPARTVNEIPPPDDVNEKEWKEGNIAIDGINSGWHTVGLLWTQTGPDSSRLQWFIDGKEFVRDSRLAPRDIEMYMILSREVSTGRESSLHDADVYDYIDTIPDDLVQVRYVRVWDVSSKGSGSGQDTVALTVNQTGRTVSGTASSQFQGRGVYLPIGAGYTANVGSDGRWSVTLPPSEDDKAGQTFNAYVDDGESPPVSKTASFVYSTGGGSSGAPSLTVSTTGRKVSGMASSHFYGRGVYLPIGGGYTANVGSDGRWSITLPSSEDDKAGRTLNAYVDDGGSPLVSETAPFTYTAS